MDSWRSCKNLRKSEVEEGNLVLRVDEKESAILTVFDRFEGENFKGKDFFAKLTYFPTKTLGKIVQIEPYDSEAPK